MDGNDSTKIETLAASGLVSAAVLAALVGRLQSLNVLSSAEVRDVYDDALLMIEEQQSDPTTPSIEQIYKPARRIIEEQLRGLSGE